jgi:hypothetical protein
VKGNGHTADELIDREGERTLFGRILEEAETVRLLTVRAGKKMGKSRLLDWLEEEGRRTFGVPSGRVEFKALKERTRYGVAEQLVTQLRDFGLGFPLFEQLDLARADKDFSLFRSQSPPLGEVVATGAWVPGGFTANQVENVVQAGGQATFVQAPKSWTGEHEEKARDRCANAFLDDLRGIAGERRMLLLFDAYEFCPDPLKKWIETRLLLQHALTDPPTRLTVVLAGPPDSIPELGRGREQVVRSVNPKLSCWDEGHVEKYLAMRGVSPRRSDIEFVTRGLRETGWTFDDLESAVDLLRPRAG